LISQVIIEATERLCPLAAIQPVYLHSYSVAKMITSLAHLYARRIHEYAGERWWRSADGARARCSTRRPRTRGSCSSSIRATKAVLREASLPVFSRRRRDAASSFARSDWCATDFFAVSIASRAMPN